MFGVLKGSSCQLKHQQREAWQGHLCGLCLSLRDNYGHPARIATNYDAAVLSVLVDAQTAVPSKSYSSNCPLRRQRKAEVTAPDNVGTQFAASIAMVMAATKIQDHVADGETAWRYFPKLAQSVSNRWLQKATGEAARFGFNVQQITDRTQQQIEIERQTFHDFYGYAEPTELAVAAAFRHTAVLTQNEQNEPILFEMGRLFGRIMYLLDSVQDLAVDVAHNRFNALYRSYPQSEILAQAKQIFHRAYQELIEQLSSLTLVRPQLAKILFQGQLKRRGRLVLSNGGQFFEDPAEEIEDLKEEEKKKKRQKVDDSADGVLPDAPHDSGFLHGCSYLYCDCGDLDCGDGLCGCGVCDCDTCDCDGDGNLCDCADGCDGADCGGVDCG